MKNIAIFLVTVFFASTSLAQKAEVVNKPFKDLQGHDNDVVSLAISPDNKYFASGSWDKKVVLWNLDSFDQEWRFKAHESSVLSIDFAHDSNFLATCSDDAHAKIWNVDSQSLKTNLPGHRSKINDIAFNKALKDRFVATVSSRGYARVFDLKKDGKRIRKISFDNVGINAVEFGPEGHRIILGMEDNRILVYNYFQQKNERTLEGHNQAIKSLDLSSDGSKILSGSSDQKAIIWDYASGEQEHVLKGHDWRVLSAKFSKDGKYAVTGSNDGTARLWSTENGKNLKTFKSGKQDYIRSVSITADNRYVFSASMVREENDSAIRIWETGMGKSMSDEETGKPDEKSPDED